MIDLSQQQGTIEVTAGRVESFDLGGEALRVLSKPGDGNVSINPDGTVALVLRDAGYRGFTSFEVEMATDGGPRVVEVPLNVVAGPQHGGWGAGDHYTLAEDDSGSSVIEPGENHRKIYVSGADDALSRADIAAREGLSTRQITDAWLADHPEYGGSPDMALDAEAGGGVWDETTEGKVTSNWLLLERGYEYEGMGRLVNWDADGESPLHPLMIGAWGDGAAPVLGDEIRIFQRLSENVVIQDVELKGGISALLSENLMLENVIFDGEGAVVQNATRFTLQEAQIIDVIEGNITNGIYVSKSDGVLIEGVFADHNGWEDGYEMGRGRTPDKFSHNFYLHQTTFDVTFRENVSSQSSSAGAQLRTGGVFENNLFAGNEVQLTIAGGENAAGNYSVMLDNVFTLAGYKEVEERGGAVSRGLAVTSQEIAAIGNIVAHLTDPTDTEALAYRTKANEAYTTWDTFVDDTIVYNWQTENFRFKDEWTNRNLPEDISKADLDEVTLKNFVQDVLGLDGGSDGVTAFAEYLRGNWDGFELVDVIRFFQEGFGIEVPVDRTASAELRFIPDERGEGFRWDNRLNWSTEDRPKDGDSVDLGGNWVSYSGTTRLDGLDLGEGGVLTVRQGLLVIEDLQTGADGRIEIGLAGQVWADSYACVEGLAIAIEAGRFANTGAFAGPVEFDVSGGEVLLATAGARFDLDGRLSIEGTRAKVGFDGQGGGAATFALAAGAELSFAADSGGLERIGEFRSGHWGTDVPDLVSRVDLGDGDTTLSLDLGLLALNPGTAIYRLVDVDELVGGFGTVELSGVARSRVSLRIDYATDQLDLVTGSWSGAIRLDLVGSEDADVFVAAADTRVRVMGYEGEDKLDLSAVIDVADLSGLSLRQTAQGVELAHGNVQLAEFVGGDIDAIRVAADGSRVTIDGSGIGEIEPEPQPEPEPGPEPEPVNTAPTALGGAAIGEAGAVMSGRLGAEDPDGDTLTFALDAGPETGRVTVGEDGSFVYDPEGVFDDLPDGESREVSFSYTVSDGRGGSDSDVMTLTLEGTYEPPDKPGAERNVIAGTPGFDVLQGSDDADLIRAGGGGLDRIWGNEGADAFVFGAEAGDGQRSSAHVLDFDPDADLLVLESGAQVASMQDRGGALWFTLEGDGDLIVLNGGAVTASNLDLIQTDDIWLG